MSKLVRCSTILAGVICIATAGAVSLPVVPRGNSVTGFTETLTVRGSLLSDAALMMAILVTMRH